MRVIVTGASRGIGAAIAKRFSCPGTQVTLLARSKPDLMETADDVEQRGGTAHPMSVNLRDTMELRTALRTGVDKMGGVDVLINNASALCLDARPTISRMNLVHEVNTRATMICIRELYEDLTTSRGSIVTMSPPIRLGRLDWVSNHPAYTISKYGMTLVTLGAASEHVRANCLWPKRTVSTAATRMVEPDFPGSFTRGRPPSHVAEAVWELVTSSTYNAQTLLDDHLIRGGCDDAPLDLFVSDDACTTTVE